MSELNWFMIEGPPEPRVAVDMEFHLMWEALIRAGGYSAFARCPRTGDRWQYMGSSRRGAAIVDNRANEWVHDFRHRSITNEIVEERTRKLGGYVGMMREGERLVLRLPCSPGWEPGRWTGETP